MHTKFLSRHKKPNLTIIIVSYNTKDLLKKCLQSIYKHLKRLKFEVIVIDNHSQDSSAQMVAKEFPKVKLIKNRENLYFCSANNQGLKLAKGKFVFFLNPDTQLIDSSLKKALQYLKKNKNIVALEPAQYTLKNKLLSTGVNNRSWLIDILIFSGFSKYFRTSVVDKFYLKHKDRKKIFQAQVICGASILARRSILNKVKGFSKTIKMYFSEDDLCLKLQKHGQLIHYAPFKIIHNISASTDKISSFKLMNHYARDAYYFYFDQKQKFKAITLFLTIYTSFILKKILPLILLIFLATWLRFYRLPEFMTFIGDQGRDYLAARDFLLTKKIPLVGIPSSVPWLHQGPLFIWLVALTLKIGDFHPIAPAVLTSTLGVLTIYFTYKLSLHWFSKYYAFLTALFLTTSPLAVIHSRMAYHISPIPFFSLLFIFSLYFLFQKKTNIFWPILLWGILFNLELTTAPLILLILLIYWLQTKSFKKFFKNFKKDFKYIISALIIPLLPKIIYDFTHGFKQTLGFIAWFGYRILSFFGYSDRHTVSFQSIKQTSLTIFDYWQKFISWNNLTITIIISLIVLTAIIHRLLITRKKKLQPQLIILFSFIALNLLAFFIHQGPSEAYFPILFPAWALLIIWAFQYLKKPILSVLLIIFAGFNTFSLINNHFIPYGPTLKQQLVISRFIKSNAQNKPFKLKNHQSVAQFNSYLDNYRYLLWWLKNPEDPQAKLTYTIYQGLDKNFLPPQGAMIYNFDEFNIKVIKQ